MLNTFFDIEWIVRSELVPWGQTVNSALYEVLQAVRMLHHDNAAWDETRYTRQFLMGINILVLLQPVYCPWLSLCVTSGCSHIQRNDEKETIWHDWRHDFQHDAICVWSHNKISRNVSNSGRCAADGVCAVCRRWVLWTRLTRKKAFDHWLIQRAFCSSPTLYSASCSQTFLICVHLSQSETQVPRLYNATSVIPVSYTVYINFLRWSWN